jgi:hypothetical protein
MLAFRLALALALMPAGISAAERQISLYGIELGKPFALPECPLEDQKDMCFQRRGGTAYDVAVPIDRGERTVTVYFASGELPSITANRFFMVMLSNGIVEEISIGTKGVSAGDVALGQLTAKFGAPGSLTKNVMQNGYGATYAKVNALWHIGGYWLSYDSAVERADQGIILALTEKEFAKIKAQSAKEPKL